MSSPFPSYTLEDIFDDDPLMLDNFYRIPEVSHCNIGSQTTGRLRLSPGYKIIYSIEVHGLLNPEAAPLESLDDAYTYTLKVHQDEDTKLYSLHCVFAGNCFESSLWYDTEKEAMRDLNKAMKLAMLGKLLKKDCHYCQQNYPAALSMCKKCNMVLSSRTYFDTEAVDAMQQLKPIKL
jgi:hypothetical protein